MSFSAFRIASVVVATLGVTGITLGISSPALAISGFSGVYDRFNFTLTNTDADGSVVTTNADAPTGTIVLTGGDDGSFAPGTTDWLISTIGAGGTGTITFEWSFTGELAPYLDSVLGDRAGYLLDGAFTELALIDGEVSAAPVSFAVTEGQSFGFRVQTANNDGGAGIFTVNNFNFVATPVPFETDASLGLLVLGGLYGGHRWLKSRSNSPLS